nr:sigma-54-dependent Fis family transcriptional regulator [uncultured Desulfobacter sp.]
MISKQSRRNALDLAWQEFITCGGVRKGKVRPEILASWRRCCEAGVDYTDGSCCNILTPEQCERPREKHDALIKTAKPFMNKLYEFVAGSGLVVFLSDESGLILESIGDGDVADNASKVNLVKGTGWREETVGTNGIGTSLKIKKPIQVSGKEHYCVKLHTWTCSAAPIFDPDHRLLGALQMSGPSHAVHLHTLGMIVAAVEAIESQLGIRENTRELTLLNQRLNGIFQTMSDGAVITDKKGLICQINPAAEAIFGSQIRGCSLKRIFEHRPTFLDAVEQGKTLTDKEFMVDAVHCLVTTRPLWDGKQAPNGAVIFFNPLTKVKKLINRFSSAQASFRFSDIIGHSLVLKMTIDEARHAASGASNILILGESGTGKELFAQAVHNHSHRRTGPFIALNCAALPRELISSELFGYADGAFTGAKRGGRPGKFELAAGGTLFLDEIGDMPLDQQAILLRVLQEKKITRVGGGHTIPVDVRVICATHKDLKMEVEKGNFRSDLYYRINVIRLQVPSLRQRPGDIYPLFTNLVKKICARQGIVEPQIMPAVFDHLVAYDWPGNVRELENVAEKMIHAGRNGCLEPDHLPRDIIENGPACTPVESVTTGTRNMAHLMTEKDHIVALLKQHRGNISRVAREMNVSRNTVYRKLKFFGICRDQSFS